MNTVLDDNKKLCLLHGEVILMNDGMGMIFETDDLAQASPATVSRCGMVYLEEKMVHVRSHLKSWLGALKRRLSAAAGATATPLILQRLSDLFEALFKVTAEFIFLFCNLLVPCSEA